MELLTDSNVIRSILKPSCTICIFKNCSPLETSTSGITIFCHSYHPPVPGTSITPRFVPFNCAKNIPPDDGAATLIFTS
ncbi:uncharacterized protein METZ01_LOCUS223046 [marine metagenome]|uniref:Uncharacterized protein n=1 Tax=marine metagenome TaxID=408172 RepID=A0A382G5Q0_9ZZZZ